MKKKNAANYSVYCIYTSIYNLKCVINLLPKNSTNHTTGDEVRKLNTYGEVGDRVGYGAGGGAVVRLGVDVADGGGDV